MHRFQYFAPQSLDEAVTLLKERGDGVKLLAGGTDLLVQMKEAGLHPGSVYQRHTPRKTMDIAAVGVGIRLTLTADTDTIREAQICLGAVAPTVIRAPEAEEALTGKPASDELFARAAELAQAAARPISDTRGSAAFRRQLVGVMTRRCLEIALERAWAT